MVSITKSDRTQPKHNFRNSKPYQTIYLAWKQKQILILYTARSFKKLILELNYTNLQCISMANLWTIHSRAFFDDTIVTNEIAHSLFYPL